MAQKGTGKASYFKYNGTKIHINKYTSKATPTLVTLTDSENYDQTTDLVWPVQVVVAMAQELSVEGWFHRDGNTANLTTKLYSGSAGPQAVQLGLDAGNLLGSGNYDISGFEVTAETEGALAYKADFKLNGIFTPGA